MGGGGGRGVLGRDGDADARRIARDAQTVCP
jgi:hypothetical protein